MTGGERKLLTDLERGPMRSWHGRPFKRLYEAGFISRVVSSIYRINHAGKAALERGRLAPSDMVPIELVVRELRTCAGCEARFFPVRDHQRYHSRACRRRHVQMQARRFSLPADGARARWTP